MLPEIAVAKKNMHVYAVEVQMEENIVADLDDIGIAILILKKSKLHSDVVARYVII